MTLATSESIVECLLRGPQDEQNKVMKWVALLLSTGLALCGRYLPWDLHLLLILFFSTARQLPGLLPLPAPPS